MKKAVLPSLLIAAVLAAGCGAAPSPAKSPAMGSAHAERVANSDDGADKEEDAAPPPAEPAAAVHPAAPAQRPAPEPAPDRDPSTALEPQRDASMIIYTARVTMAVYQVDQGLTRVERIARDQGGYLSLKRDREITIRVPRQKFEAALAAIDELGDILHRDVQAQDVTDEFVDLEIRIKNARAMQARLKALLEKAAVKEALEIEKEMRRVTEELELLEGKIKLLRDKIAYSTITVVFEPRGSTLQATRVRLPFPWLQQLGLPSLLTLGEEKLP